MKKSILGLLVLVSMLFAANSSEQITQSGFSFMPKVIFHFTYKILSPLLNPNLRKKLSSLYNRIKSFRIIQKNMTGVSNQ